VLSTLTQEATLSLTVRNGARFAGPVLGFDPSDSALSNESWGKLIKLGPLSVGQSREVVVPLYLPADFDPDAAAPYLEAVLTYTTSSQVKANHSAGRGIGGGRGGGSDGRTCRTSALGTVCTASPDAWMAELRCETVTVGSAAVKMAVGGKGRTAMKSIKELGTKLSGTAWHAGQHHQGKEGDAAQAALRLKALNADVSGRMVKALTGAARFNRWGKHYLRALIRAHQCQLCTNYMDPGLQVYGGELFLALKAQGDITFLGLPPPSAEKPPPPPTQTAPAPRPRGQPANAAATVTRAHARQAVEPPVRQRPPSPDMNAYYQGSGGGCFAEGSTVGVVALDSDGHSDDDGDVTATPVEHVRAGDTVQVAGGRTARVRCVVAIDRPAFKQMVRLKPSGLTITPKHPVRLGPSMTWKRPRDLCGDCSADAADGATLVDMPAAYRVFNFVLEPDEAEVEGEEDEGRVLLVNGVECVTWGHGLQGDVVSSPAYFGSSEIINDLAVLPGFDEGLVHLRTGFINGTAKCASENGAPGSNTGDGARAVVEGGR